jgi:hypothetical protein
MIVEHDGAIKSALPNNVCALLCASLCEIIMEFNLKETQKSIPIIRENRKAQFLLL